MESKNTRVLVNDGFETASRCGMTVDCIEQVFLIVKKTTVQRINWLNFKYAVYSSCPFFSMCKED